MLKTPLPQVYVPRRRRAGARSGSTAVEFALVGLLLVSLLVVMFEASIQLFAGMALDYGTRAAARFGVTGAPYPPSMASNPPADREKAIRALVLQAGGGFLQDSRLVLQLTNYPTMPASGAGNSGAGGQGNTVRYQATYTQPFATGLATQLFGQSAIQHQVVLWVQNEPF